MIANNILDVIGHTPMVRINRITRGLTGVTVVAKLETFNPGNSIKDRMAVKMIEDAERTGLLKPGGTIIEGHLRQHRHGARHRRGRQGLQVRLHDHRQAVEGEDRRAEGVRRRGDHLPDQRRPRGSAVVLLGVVAPRRRKSRTPGRPTSTTTCRTPRRTTSRPGRKSGSRPTGRVTHLVVGVGTGGTVTGVGRYLKERNPTIKVWGIDTYGSVFKKYKETGIFDKHEIYPYITEGIGEDFLPRNVDFSVIDHFEKVTDKDAALMTRRLAREEGIFAGNSAGSAMAGLLQLKDHFREGDVVVVIFHDHGSRYLGKMFNDDWMREKGFMEKTGMAARDLVAAGLSGELFSLECNEPVAQAIRRDERARLLADLGDARQAARRIAERGAPLPGTAARSRHQEPAGGVDHAAGVSVRGRLHAGRSAGDHDHAAEPRRPRARFQDRKDVHHHAVSDLIRVL